MNQLINILHIDNLDLQSKQAPLKLSVGPPVRCLKSAYVPEQFAVANPLLDQVNFYS